MFLAQTSTVLQVIGDPYGHTFEYGKAGRGINKYPNTEMLNKVIYVI